MKLPYIEQNLDRHGNVRVYVRRGGRYLGRIHAKPGTAEFLAEYQALLASTPVLSRGAAGTIAWLAQQYYLSGDFRQLDGVTQKRRRSIIDRVTKRIGSAKIAHLERRHIVRLRDERADTPDAANGDVKALRAMFRWAVDAGHAATDPTDGVRKLRPINPTGFHDWTEAEIAAYETRHPVGTKARLALDLLLYSGVRRSDVVRLGPQMEQDDELHFTEFKGRRSVGKTRVLPILPVLRASIDATPSGHLAYLVTAYGKPFTAAGFGNWFRDRCDEAGLPGCSAHGLRKAGARRAAEAGATSHQLMALFGWRSASQADTYTRAADRKTLTSEAVVLLQKVNKTPTPGGA